MIIEIDFNSSEAIYLQLRNQIVVAIAQERLKQGESLPSVRQMAETLDVNMHTVNKAYALLREEGYLQLDRRRGAVVAVIPDKDAELDALCDDLQMIVARAICKGVSKEELLYAVDMIYNRFV